MAEYRYLGINVLFLKFMGMYPLGDKINPLFRIIYYVWRFICLFCLFTHSIQCIVDIFVRTDFELTAVSANILNAVIFMGGVVRLTYYYINANGIKTLTDRLNETFRFNTVEGVESKTVEWHVKFAKNLSIFWFWDVFLTGELMAMLPLFFRGSERVLPIPAWYPWNWKKSPFYEISYFLQILTNLHMSFVYGNSDMLYVSYCILIGGQFSLLGTDYKNCMYTALLKFGISSEKVMEYSKLHNSVGNGLNFGNGDEVTMVNPAKLQIEKILETSEFKTILTKVLNDCIEHHQMLLEYCEAVESFFSPIILPSLSFAMFYVIFMLFKVVTTTDADTTIFLFYVSYICCGLLQIFLINYFGQFLTTQSEVARDTLYEMPWYETHESFKTSFKFVQMRFGKPITLTAGKFFDISLQTFIAIAKMSFSYFTVLRKVTGPADTIQ